MRDLSIGEALRLEERIAAQFELGAVIPVTEAEMRYILNRVPSEEEKMARNKVIEQVIDQGRPTDDLMERVQAAASGELVPVTEEELKLSTSSLKPLSGRDALIDAHRHLCNDARALMLRKNLDYASEADPFRNFRAFGRLGILVRLSDKLARLRSLSENGTAAVQDETERDTILDICNYAVLYDQYPKEEAK